MIVRAIVLRDASVTGVVCACTGAGVGTVKDLGSRAPGGPNLYAARQIFEAPELASFVQANSSSGFTALNPGTDIAFWTCTAATGGDGAQNLGVYCHASQWQYVPWNCASATSTNRNFYRAGWRQTCRAGGVTWLLAIDVR